MHTDANIHAYATLSIIYYYKTYNYNNTPARCRVKPLLRSLRFRTKQVIKVMRAKDKGDKKNKFR